MKIISLQGSNPDFLNSLKEEKPLFLVASSYSKTAEISGITVAGLPGKIYLTPPLDMEVLYYGKPKTVLDIATMPEGPPSPVIITSAMRNLIDFPLHFLDIGLKVKPKCPITCIDVEISNSLLEGAEVDAEFLFNEGLLYSKHLSQFNKTIVISECVPSGTTSAFAVSKALGYDCDSSFSSSNFSTETYDLKKNIVNEAINNHKNKISSVFDAIHYLGDNMQAFVSGLSHGLAKNNIKVILAGGTQMAAIFGILNKLKGNTKFENIALMSTKWILNDTLSDIESFLNQIDININAYFSDFSFEESQYHNLRLYEKGYVKEGVGCGASLCFAYLNNFNQSQILNEIESIYSLVQ